MAKKNRKLLFLKSTNALIGEITDLTPMDVYDLTKFNTLDVEIDEAAGEYFYGTYDQWEIRNREVNPVVTETMVKYLTNVKILNVYPIHKQLNILINVLKNNQSIIKTDEFNEMIEFLDAQKQEHQLKIASYSNTEMFHWVSAEEEAAANEAKAGVNLL
jgi:hypothetical protein